ncbi:MAG: histidine triad nucleotide-binding protein [Oscillospiraceae bacterium]|jgi:histidine triad (HIT) family protein|nr:histidine triad nucleotide-binding protein [Oscillospiraceae bacterium]
MPDDCLFCKIASGAIPSKKAHEDDLVLAFYDIAPAAPVHILVIPKQHIPSAAALGEQHAALLGHLFAVIAKLAAELKLDDGFRVVSNVGELAGQSVPHLHFHLLSGRALAWPPG